MRVRRGFFVSVNVIDYDIFSILPTAFYIQ